MRIVLLFALCILSSGAAGNLYKQLSEKSRNPADSAAFPILWYLPLFLLFLPSVVVGKERTLIPAAIAGGMFLFIAAFLLLESMKQTSLAAAVIIVNLNFLIPVILSVTILKERIALLQLGGMLVSAAAVVILNLNGSSGKEGRGIRPLLLPLVACFANGLLNFTIKLNEEAYGGRNAFFAVLYGSAALSAAVFHLICRLREGRTKGKKAASPPLSRRTLLPAVAMAFSNGLCFWTESAIAGQVNAAAQFTIVTAASIALSLAIGAIWQHEPVRPRTAVSFLACLCAILCQAVSL